MFDSEIKEIKSFLKFKNHNRELTCFDYDKTCSWPSGEGRNIIFKEDTGLEIGNPQAGSVSFLLWSDNLDMIDNGRISVIGPDISEASSSDLPFCKIVIAGVEGFNKDNTFKRYRDLEAIRYDIDLKGYMMKGTSQYQREWSRISKEAISNGFSFKHLGNALIEKFRETDYVTSVEIIFVTTSSKDVSELGDIAIRVGRIINAMNKMLEEMSLDCEACEYLDVCDQVRELKEMKESLEKDNIASSLSALED